MTKNLDLYLDESGSFERDEANQSVWAESSMVGGLLIDPDRLTDETIHELLPHAVHCCEYYDKGYLNVLQRIKDMGGQFVVFENKERIHVVNSDITYLNIISEGLVKLMQDLSLEYRDGISLRIIIATRKNMEAEKAFYSTILKPEEYQNRLDEKLILAFGKNRISGCHYNLLFMDARKFRRLDFADIICNTYKTRNRKKKFSAEEQGKIQSLFNGQKYYQVFEDAVSKYLKQLLIDRHFGEAICQICMLPKLSGYTGLRNTLIKGLETYDGYEQETILGQISLQIGQYNRVNRYEDGIRFAENYKKYFLDILNESGHPPRNIKYWNFDTNYYLLTMYDHVGNAEECQKFLDICHESIGCINHSWEHIDYYFGFCVRELNVLMGRFAFEKVLKRSGDLIRIFEEAKELFSMIETFDGTQQTLRSELLGKAYGVRVEAMINLLGQKPELFENALAASDAALDEFEDARDISRQYQWRCLLMAEMGKANEAYDALLKAAGVTSADSETEFLDRAYAMTPGTYDFLLWHYTNVLLLLRKMNDPRGKTMADALFKHPGFKQDLDNENKTGHPWNLVLWNVARYYRLCGNLPEFKNRYRCALKITRENKANVTMMTYALSMAADWLYWCRVNNSVEKAKAQADFMSIYKEVSKVGMTEEMRRVFFTEEIKNSGSVTDGQIRTIKTAYLK